MSFRCFCLNVTSLCFIFVSSASFSGRMDGALEALTTGEQYLDVSVVPMVQSAQRAGAETGNYTLDVIGKFTVFDRPAKSAVGNTDIILWINSSGRFGGLGSASELASDAGLLWDTNDIDTDSSNTSYLVLAVDQWFMEDKLSVAFGKFFPGQSMLASSYLADNSNTFTSKLISSNPVVSWWESIGIGSLVGYWGDSWFVQGGFVDAKAGPDDLDFSSFSDHKYAYMAEGSYALPREADDEGESTVGAVIYYVDERNNLDSESGIVAQFTHEFGANQSYALFGRYSLRKDGEALTIADLDNAPALKRGAFIGGAWNHPFGKESQQLGVALMQGTASDYKAQQGYNDQYGVESYWRFQPKPWLKLMPSIQLLRNIDDDIETVIGLRISAGFTRNWAESSLFEL